jgi:MFS transporter, putative metabolite:H+ symporter
MGGDPIHAAVIEGEGVAMDAARMQRPIGGMAFTHPRAFWFGIGAVTAGVLLHLPMFFGARDMGYRLVGENVDGMMIAGMGLILVGLAATFYGLLPRLSEINRGPVSRIRVRALDDAPIKPAHVALLIVMAVAITIDVMKPAAVGFVVPGMAEEYGLKSVANPTGTLPVAWLPFAGITGTITGAFLWGWLSDKIGRRPTILLAGVIFIGTAICGAMPNPYWNFLMCFIMGLGVGGMLPITFTLMAEAIPARHRGWLIVLIGGDIAAAYIVTSWLASTAAAPDSFGWRLLWLVGLPTGVLLIVLNRWIPESPRFLLAQGRDEEARVIMERYGAVVVEDDRSELQVEERVKGRFSQLLTGPFAGLSVAILLLGIGIGVVQSGFQLWIPSNLQQLGFTEIDSSRVLRNSALLGFPLNLVIAYLYGFWSSRKTIILLAAVTAAALFGFVIAGNEVATNKALLYGLLIAPIWGISSLTAATVAYASEVYPTRIRSRGTGLASAATRFGGLLIISMVLATIAAPSISITALLGALPLSLAVLAIVVFGIETRKKQLEEITAEELLGVPSA